MEVATKKAKHGVDAEVGASNRHEGWRQEPLLIIMVLEQTTEK
jgi:hypothetical protein